MAVRVHTTFLLACVVVIVPGPTYALLASPAGTMLSGLRSRLLMRANGGCLIGGGLRLALSRSK
jgi:hypothetical protein